MRMKVMVSLLFMAVALAAAPCKGFAQEVFPVAILSFEERGPGLKGQGVNVADLLFANLIESPNLLIVERTELDKILTEGELNLSGHVSTGQANQIGQLTGAKLIISGSIFKVNKKIHIVAKIIGTETSKVLGKSVNGIDDLDVLVSKLAQQINAAINASAKDLMPPVVDKGSIVEEIKKSIEGKSLPAIQVAISEVHLSQAVPDPAAQTELMYLYKEVGGSIIDPSGDSKKAVYFVQGEGFSEFSTRIKNFVSVKARLEVKVVDQEGNVIAVDRQTAVKVDLNEMLAGKAALQEAAAMIARRIIPQMAR
ncbi:MAG: CsgG/HfaB family protein [Candidatus Omnitrophica bacterium]|nr:CsgG/HfaB family protein [Candidatus Omnitrophota bacterium]